MNRNHLITPIIFAMLLFLCGSVAAHDDVAAHGLANNTVHALLHALDTRILLPAAFGALLLYFGKKLSKRK